MAKTEFQHNVSNNTCQFEVISKLDYVYKNKTYMKAMWQCKLRGIIP